MPGGLLGHQCQRVEQRGARLIQPAGCRVEYCQALVILSDTRRQAQRASGGDQRALVPFVCGIGIAQERRSTGVVGLDFGGALERDKRCCWFVERQQCTAEVQLRLEMRWMIGDDILKQLLRNR